jgi:hypothetical protein
MFPGVVWRATPATVSPTFVYAIFAFFVFVENHLVDAFVEDARVSRVPALDTTLFCHGINIITVGFGSVRLCHRFERGAGAWVEVPSLLWAQPPFPGAVVAIVPVVSASTHIIPMQKVLLVGLAVDSVASVQARPVMVVVDMSTAGRMNDTPVVPT